ncbi:MAG: SCO family protein [Myxococcota bacterium]|nr:SCO family protein [Myxococcota bacterium]
MTLLPLVLGGLLMGCHPESEPSEEPIRKIDYAEIESRLEPRPARGKTSDAFPNIRMTDQHGRAYSFFDDLIEDRAVVVNFMFTQCALICPGTTSHLARLHAAFAGAVGTDVTFISVTLDPENDSVEALHDYWEAFGSHEGWLYLRGDYEETELLRRRMGVYDLDPIIDADKTQHGGILTFGNDATDRWAALPALSTIRDLQDTIIRFALAGNRPRRRALEEIASGLAGAEEKEEEEAKVYSGRGVVRGLDPGRAEIVLEHREIADLMPAMTMTFSVAEAVSLEAFSVGQEVAFGLVNKATGFEVVEMAGAQPEKRLTGAGARDYELFCASCHGGGGHGDGPLAAALDPRPAKHSDGDYMNGLSDDYLFRVIAEGGPAVGKSPLMAAWGGTLSEARIQDLVAFIRTLASPAYAPGG